MRIALVRQISVFIFLIGVSLVSTPAVSNEGSKIYTFAVDDWCPQHCQDSDENEGYIIDIVRNIFALRNLPIKILYVPWQRAVRGTVRGQFDGLLTPTKTSNPELLFHQQAVGHQEYCIYAKRDSDWTYTGFSSFKSKSVAYLKGSGLGELDLYIEANKSEINTIQFAGNKNYVSDLFNFLDAGRADTVIMTSDVYHFAVKQKVISDRFKTMGCLGKELLYVGLSPENKERSEEIMLIIDDGIAKLRRSGKLKTIFETYGIPYF